MIPELILDIGFTGAAGIGNVFTVGDPIRGQVGMSPIGDGTAWTRIDPALIRSWSAKGGSSKGDSPTLRYDAATGSVVLHDPDRRFDMENLLGPYVVGGRSQVEPMVRVRLRAVYGGITYAMIVGYADDFVIEYEGNFWTYVTLPFTDASVIFAANDRDPSTVVGAGDTSGGRMNRILDNSGWPATERIIATGDTTLQATDLSGNQMAEMQLVQDTEQGDLFIDGQGWVVFRNRQAMLKDPRSAISQARFGDGGFVQPVAVGFENGDVGWVAYDATRAVSALQFHSGTQSLLLTVVGTPGQAYTRPGGGFPAIAGRDYQLSMWVYCPVACGVGAAIDWLDASNNYMSTSYQSNAVPAGVWTQLQLAATAPVGATAGQPGPTLESSPPTGRQLFLDDVTWTDLDNELPYADVKPSSPGENIVNDVTVSRAGGAAQNAVDVASKSRYLKKSHQRLDLLHQTDTESLQLAEAILYQYATPRPRFARLEFRTPPPQLEAAIWPAILGRKIGDRITVLRRPKGGGDPIERDCFVRGWEHASDGVSWTSAFVLQSAERFSFFVVGDPILGRVGMNAVAY